MINTILSLMHRSLKWSHSFRFTAWIFLHSSHSLTHATWLAHIIFLEFIILIHNMLNCYNAYSHLLKCGFWKLTQSFHKIFDFSGLVYREMKVNIFPLVQTRTKPSPWFLFRQEIFLQLSVLQFLAANNGDPSASNHQLPLLTCNSWLLAAVACWSSVYTCCTDT